jgi:iron complex transport system substrate-binding protein
MGNSSNNSAARMRSRPAAGSPREAARQAFTSANIDKILALKPDLVLTFSDLQAEIAADLIRRGLNVHASINEALPRSSI